jgi:hypothetical protein
MSRHTGTLALAAKADQGCSTVLVRLLYSLTLFLVLREDHGLRVRGEDLDPRRNEWQEDRDNEILRRAS